MKITSILVACAGFALAIAAPNENTKRTPAYPKGITATPVSPAKIPSDFKIVARDENPNLQRRHSHGVYLCNDRNYQGYCRHITAPAGVCVPLGPDLEDQVTAAGPDKGAYCRFFFERDCQLDQGHYDDTYPGIPDLGSYGDHSANDRISSYICWDE